MKKTVLLALMVLILILAGTVPSYAHGHRSHFRGEVWIGQGWDPWWPSAYPYYPYYSYYPYYNPYYWDAPVVTEPQQQEYIAPAPKQDEDSYWYFCQNPKGYYPYVKRCPSGWMKVVPSVVPPDEKE